jgi:hypothetical protein
VSLVVTSLYTPEELIYRPIEHTLEVIAESRRRQATCKELGHMLGCDKNSAAALLRGERDATEEEVKRLRNLLASSARNGNVPRDSRAPASATSRGPIATLETAEVCT